MKTHKHYTECVPNPKIEASWGWARPTPVRTDSEPSVSRMTQLMNISNFG